MDTKALKEAVTHFSQARDLIEIARDARQDFFDEKSEEWQQSEKGEQLESEIAELNECLDNLENAEVNLNNAIK